jgi:hypothetical protein
MKHFSPLSKTTANLASPISKTFHGRSLRILCKFPHEYPSAQNDDECEKLREEKMFPRPDFVVSIFTFVRCGGARERGESWRKFAARYENL